MSKIGKLEFIDQVAEKAGISKKDATIAINAAFDVITEDMKKGIDITVPGFGSFKVQEVKAKKGRNIATGEAITIPKHKRVKFTAGKTLVDAVSKKKKK